MSEEGSGNSRLGEIVLEKYCPLDLSEDEDDPDNFEPINTDESAPKVLEQSTNQIRGRKSKQSQSRNREHAPLRTSDVQSMIEKSLKDTLELGHLASAHLVTSGEITIDAEVNGTKNHCCLFCGKLVKNLWKHQTSIHGQEARVIACLEPGEEQINLRKRLRIDGDFMHNIRVLKEQRGKLLVSKKSSADYKDYTCCPRCHEFVSCKNYYNHQRKEHSSDTETPVDLNNSRRFLIRETNGVSPLAAKVFSGIKDDAVGQAIKNDLYIIRYLEFLCLNDDGSQTPEWRQNLRNMLRLIGLAMTMVSEKVTSLNLLGPGVFNDICLKTKNCESSTAKIRMGTALKKYTLFLKGEAIIANDANLLRKCENFFFLLEERWETAISASARKYAEPAYHERLEMPLTEVSYFFNY